MDDFYDDFYDDDDDDDYLDTRDDGARRPFLPQRNSASSASRKSRPHAKRSNSIKMKPSHASKLGDAFRDDEAGAKKVALWR